MFDLTRKPSKESGPHLKACSLKPSMIHECHIALGNRLNCWHDVKKKVCGCSEQLHLSRIEVSWEISETKRLVTARPTVALYVNELRSQNCKFRRQVCRHSPWAWLKWAHGTMSEPPRKELDHCSDPLGTESHNMQLDRVYVCINIKKYIHMYIYMGFGGHQLRLKCAQVHHQSAAGTFTRVPGRCLRWSRTPSGPWWSPAFVFF